MATKDNLTIHEVKDKPRILVDKDSNAAKLVSDKFVDKTSKNRLRTGSSVGDNEIDENEKWNEDDDDATDPGLGDGELPAPEFKDIFLKRNEGFENINPLLKYGKLVKDTVNRTTVQLEFRVMVPLDLKDEIVGIEILSQNEVVAEI